MITQTFAEALDGADGRDGTPGLPGTVGPAGPKGDKGDKGETGGIATIKPTTPVTNDTYIDETGLWKYDGTEWHLIGAFCKCNPKPPVEPTYHWRGKDLVCLKDGNGDNTGMQQYLQLERINELNNTVVETVDNTPAHPNYIAPAQNLEACSLPTFHWRGKNLVCLKDGTGNNTGMQQYQQLERVNDTTSAVVETVTNTPAHPNYIAPVQNLAACPIPIVPKASIHLIQPVNRGDGGIKIVLKNALSNNIVFDWGYEHINHTVGPDIFYVGLGEYNPGFPVKPIFLNSTITAGQVSMQFIYAGWFPGSSYDTIKAIRIYNLSGITPAELESQLPAGVELKFM